MIIGIDFASGPDMHAEMLISNCALNFYVGDRVKVAADANSVRRYVKRKLSDRQWQIETFKRPSRGFAKHIRRMKSQ